MLNTIRHGAPTAAPTLLIAHGLYGSARNWGVIARRLSEIRQVIAVDMRNHGYSPWHPTHSYADLATDLAEVIEAEGSGPVDVLGHSMGGKAAMVLALSRPDLVRRLIVADIAPVPYGHTQAHVAEAMKSVDLTSVSSRAEAGEQMGLADPATTSFVLQSLNMAERRWRLNLDVLLAGMNTIIGFPDVAGVFEGPVLFLTGALSSYVLPQHRSRIKELFPKARFAGIPGAGHWLHADKPRETEAAVRIFLEM